jgi:DNA-binding NtrC family response regulator
VRLATTSPDRYYRRVTDGTVTTFRDDASMGADRSHAPALIVLMECDHPVAGSTWHCLAGVSTVKLGRGTMRAAERLIGNDRSPELRLRLPDRRMSSTHASIDRALGRWVASDSESKNGTFVNGEQISRHTMKDGDILEVGRTLLLYRDAVPTDEPLDRVYDGSAGLASFVPAIQDQLAQLARVARTDVSIMLHGETGTGKEVFARAVHDISEREGDMVAVNCGALPETLVEAHLFGHARGAFSGATEAKRGWLRAADGGTLLLDEIGDLPLASQAALLRVLQEGEVVPVGETTPIPLDLRVITATHHDLEAAVENKTFRADLYARLSGLRVDLIPLRDRLEDMGILVAALLRRLAGDRADTVQLSRDAALALLRYDWPLNVRELEKALKTALALADDTIELSHLPAAVKQPRSEGAQAAPELTDEQKAERTLLLELLEKHSGNVSAAARELGKARLQVHRLLKRYRIDASEFRR